MFSSARFWHRWHEAAMDDVRRRRFALNDEPGLQGNSIASVTERQQGRFSSHVFPARSTPRRPGARLPPELLAARRAHSPPPAAAVQPHDSRP